MSVPYKTPSARETLARKAEAVVILIRAGFAPNEAEQILEDFAIIEDPPGLMNGRRSIENLAREIKIPSPYVEVFLATDSVGRHVVTIEQSILDIVNGDEVRKDRVRFTTVEEALAYGAHEARRPSRKSEQKT